jgi:catalase
MFEAKISFPAPALIERDCCRMSDPDIGERLVDSLHATYGHHQGHRAAHAKGVLCAATFVATDEAAALTTAAHLDPASGPIRAHVRFSNGGGNPTVPDSHRDARGMSVKWYLPDGSTTDVVALSLPVFFARTPEDLLEFNVARRPDPATGAPDAAVVGAYLEGHPEAVPAVMAAVGHPIPASYAGLAYYGLHTFWFVDADGERRAVRYTLQPAAGESALTDDEATAAGSDYLATELEDRFGSAPVVFFLDATLAAPGDPIDDPTAQWPAERTTVRLGELTITGIATDRERDGDVLVFDPTRVTPGIECSDDPILHARSAAYRVSVTRRTSG